MFTGKPLVGGVFVCAFAVAAHGDTVSFNDRASFETAAGSGLSTIGFENIAANNQANYVGSPSFSLGGVTFKSNLLYVSDSAYASGYYSLGTGDTLLAGYENFPGSITLVAELANGTRSVGMDVGLQLGGTYTISLANGATVTRAVGAAPYVAGQYARTAEFIGFRSDSDITSIRFDTPVGGGWKILDNFTTGSVQAMPLPAAAWGGLALLGGLGVARRLRRREGALD